MIKQLCKNVAVVALLYALAISGIGAIGEQYDVEWNYLKWEALHPAFQLLVLCSWTIVPYALAIIQLKRKVK